MADCGFRKKKKVLLDNLRLQKAEMCNFCNFKCPEHFQIKSLLKKTDLQHIKTNKQRLNISPLDFKVITSDGF